MITELLTTSTKILAKIWMQQESELVPVAAMAVSFLTV